MPSVIVFLVTVVVENEIDNQMVLGPVTSLQNSTVLSFLPCIMANFQSWG